jgi:superfamily II DNA/RNA helicase
MSQFGLKTVEFLNNGSLHKIENPEKYDLIIVDEAHKFRTDTAIGYTELQKLCKSPSSLRLPDGTKAPKKVILVSATPLNNRPNDIRNLVFLFKDGKDNTLEISNLSGYFAKVIEEYKKIQKLPQKQMLIKVAHLYADVREKIIKPLTIRRTRRDLTENKDYKDDLDKQGIHFPIVEKPEIILYKLDPVIELLYDETIRLLIHPVEGLGYFRYRGLAFLKPELKEKYKAADLTSNQLSRIMKTLLLKRLDSSFYAFKSSIKRFLQAAESMMKMKENGRIIIAPNLNVNQYILDDNEETLFELVAELIDTDPTISIVSPDDFSPLYWAGMKKDIAILLELNHRWSLITSDPKLESFVVALNNGLFDPLKNKEGKLVIFSESKETTDYLYKSLVERDFKKVITVDSSNRKKLMPQIIENFDANFNKEKQQDDISIIITTEVLAEGVNLHRSNSIVNYDTPWNSTRLMQRIGRVNRIGSTAARVYSYNFYPTTQVESDIELKKKAILKLQSFHSALGEDSQIYSEEEEVETFGIFEKIQQEDRDERLAYLMELRQFKKENPEEFRRIKNMPLRARTGRKDPIKNNGTLGYIKNKKRDAFYFVDKGNQITELTFPETAKQFKASIKELPYPIHEHHHEQINIAVKDFYDKMQTDAATRVAADGKQSPREKSVLAFLSAVEKLSFLNKEETKLISKAKEAIKKGRFADLQRQLFTLNQDLKVKGKPPVQLADEVLNIIHQFPVQKDSDEEQHPVSILDFEQFKPQIIISESFIH